MLKKPMQNISHVESIETHREEVSIWKLCSMVSQGKKDSFGQIQE
jgi:hypothetical protein